MEIAIELGYQLVTIVFFNVVYHNISNINGWSYYEILFFAGLNIVGSEFYLSTVYIFNLSRLSEIIKNGDIDSTFLQPINSLFNLSFKMPYFTGFISMLSGFYLMAYAWFNLHLNISFINITEGLFIFLCGMIIFYSILIVSSSLSFIFTNAKLHRIGGDALMSFKGNPHTIYQGPLKVVFFYIVPVVFMTSIPSYTILHGTDIQTLITACILAIIFFTFAIKVWDILTKYYSSASS